MGTVFEASIRNESNADGNIIAGSSVNLRWQDIANAPCTDCGNKIKVGEWSFIGYESPPSRYIRYCDACKRKRESEGTLHDWMGKSAEIEFDGISDYFIRVPEQMPEPFVFDGAQVKFYRKPLSYPEIQRAYRRLCTRWGRILYEIEYKWKRWCRIW